VTVYLGASGCWFQGGDSFFGLASLGIHLGTPAVIR